ncbi:unnamed protein product [Caenorhabditis bovis]|uniref:Uncharacterized protein n=1 Tax=Caenorhabditis bovis TaxID=2654633 RepID=A0A8S1ESU0_9PELO|nr:unnamed protein product [Caenorhabditis bovis]
MILRGETIDVSKEPIHQVLLKRLEYFQKKKPDSPAFLSAENRNDCVTRGDLIQYTLRISEWFIENGYKKGDVILVAANNDWRAVVVFFAAWRAGIIVSPACPLFTKYEMEYQLNDSTAKMVFADKSTIHLFDHHKIKHLVCLNDNVPNTLSFDELISRPVRHLKMPDIDTENDLVFLPYSSGTTGKPKGVMLAHENLATMLAAVIKKIEDAAEKYGLPRDFAPEYDLHFLPIYHVMGFFRTLISCYRGTCQLMFHKFDLDLVLKLVEEYSITALNMVPAVLVRLVNSPLLKKYDLSSLMSIALGSAPLPEGVLNKLLSMYPQIKVVQGYGMTELTLASHLPAVDSPPLSVGRLIPGFEMKVKKEDGSLCGVGEIGECWLKGPQLMKGYWKKQDLMKEILDEDGFMRTGDIVYYDKNGDTFICDRAKELIKVNAKQVAPAELESVLLEHDNVVDACVFGVDDVSTGEKPVAAVVPKYGKDQKIAEDIIRYINRKLAKYKNVNEIIFVNEIARTATGKILRRTMKKAYLDAKKSRL